MADDKKEVLASEGTEGVEEKTTQEDSASSEGQAELETNDQTTDEQSSDDSEDDSELLSSQDLSEKTKERIKNLSSRVKELESEKGDRGQRNDLLSKLNPASQAQTNDGQGFDPASQALQEVGKLRVETLVKEAEGSYPQLDKKSKEYDKDFDDLVAASTQEAWSRGENISIKDAADRVTSYIDKRAKLAQAEGEKSAMETVSEKERASYATTVKPAKGATNLTSLFNRATKTGKTEDWVAYEDAKAEASEE